jgi:antitoxin (DNA-binding transcriptional repressor) of toxin-antitoxin stability system
MRIEIIEGHWAVLYGSVMKISVTDLRRHMDRVWQALERKEEVWIVKRGRPKGVIKPVHAEPQVKVQDHPFFDMRTSPETVEQRIDRLRGGRFRDL